MQPFGHICTPLIMDYYDPVQIRIFLSDILQKRKRALCGYTILPTNDRFLITRRVGAIDIDPMTAGDRGYTTLLSFLYPGIVWMALVHRMHRIQEVYLFAFFQVFTQLYIL